MLYSFTAPMPIQLLELVRQAHDKKVEVIWDTIEKTIEYRGSRENLEWVIANYYQGSIYEIREVV